MARNIASGEEFVLAICKVYGIDPSIVKEVNIHARFGYPLSVDFVCFGDHRLISLLENQSADTMPRPNIRIEVAANGQ